MSPLAHRAAAALAAILATACAHQRNRLIDRLEEGPVHFEAGQVSPTAEIVSLDVENRTLAVGPGRAAAGALRVALEGPPLLCAVPFLIPTFVVADAAFGAADDAARWAGLRAWRRLDENAASPAGSEERLLEAVRGGEFRAEIGEALIQGAVKEAAQHGRDAPPWTPNTPGAARLVLALERVRFVHQDGKAPLAVTAAFGAEIHWPQGTWRTVVPEVDPEALLLGAWLADGGARLREALLGMARRAGARAVEAHLDSLDGLALRGRNALRPVSSREEPVVTTAPAPMRHRLVRRVPVTIDPTFRTVAWGAWTPADPLPEGTSVHYQFRAWKAPRARSDDPPAIELDGLDVPVIRLPDDLVEGQLYEWSVRAVIAAGGRRLATTWACDWVSADAPAPGTFCLPYELRVSPGGAVAGGQ